MRAEPEILDVETFGNATRYGVVRAMECDARSWISDAPICELLMTHHISHVGRMWAKPPFTEIGCVSPEHLRRLCQQQLSRSPIRHVTYLRMRRVVHYLTTSHDRAETIGQAVEYESPLTFSNAFKRWTGKRPSEFRE
ncbi:MAG: helix-turn-helix transcriptional regulator [Verrucomicrobiales bacterium]|nr:helix-turn-helix transcriptional regulator [Verrucomicrobiales bacterium]